MARPLTRRHFLRYSGVTVGGLAYASALGPLAEAFPPLAPASLELSPRRQATLAATVVAIATVVPAVDAQRADAVAAAAGEAWPTQSSDDRLTGEACLDEVERHLEPGGFTRLSPEARVAVLRAGLSGRGDRVHGIPRHASPGQALLVSSAIAMAATPFFNTEWSRWTPDRFPMQ